MQAFYDQFVEKVAESRSSTPEKIDAIAQGRVWTGRQARERGLVDELGGLPRALAIAQQRAGIAKDTAVQVVIYPPKPSVFEALSSLGGSQGVRASLAEALLSQAGSRHARRDASSAADAPSRRVARAAAVGVRAVGQRQPGATVRPTSTTKGGRAVRPPRPFSARSDRHRTRQPPYPTGRLRRQSLQHGLVDADAHALLGLGHVAREELRALL